MKRIVKSIKSNRAIIGFVGSQFFTPAIILGIMIVKSELGIGILFSLSTDTVLTYFFFIIMLAVLPLAQHAKRRKRLLYMHGLHHRKNKRWEALCTHRT